MLCFAVVSTNILVIYVGPVISTSKSYGTDLHEICTIGRRLASDIGVKLFYRFFHGSCRGNQICVQIATLNFEDIG